MSRVEINPNFTRYIKAVCFDSMNNAAIEFYRDCQRRINVDNDDGWLRSQAPNPPHKSGGTGPHKEIVHQPSRENNSVRVGVTEKGFHLYFQEVGTRAHAIRPVNARILRIPWRAEGRGRREPTTEEIKRIGLRNENGEWVYYRDEVLHPGQEPRPWLVATLNLLWPKYLKIAQSPPDSYRGSQSRRIRETV